MIYDKRELTLTKPALIAALKLGQNINGFGLPPGDILDASPQSDGGCEVRIERLGGGLATFMLAPEATMAAVIAYARVRRIPLPKRAAKQLSAVDGAVVITMALTIDT